MSQDDKITGHASFVWKHVPRETDTDKVSLKRIVLLKLNTFRANFQKRWLEYQPEQARLAYYKSADEEIAAGVVFVSDMSEVSLYDSACTAERAVTGAHKSEGSPTVSKSKANLRGEYGFEVKCTERTFIFCAESKKDMEKWIAVLKAAIDEAQRAKDAEVEEINSKHLRIADMCDTPEEFMTSSLFSRDIGAR